ncbi:hypothetical protein [Paraburkholderia sp. EG304]|uniref:hypothetical protein n=1 Tax=Paraburkholderia sp. EG304 TaxID=3237015 RepID=UPI00397D3277
MGTIQKMKGVGFGLAAIALTLFGLAIAVALIFGITWLSVHFGPWLRPAFSLTLLACIFGFVPLAAFRKTRGFSAVALLIASFLFGAILWVASVLVTLQLWGTLALFIGIFIMGVGVVPVAFLAALFHGDWSVLGSLAMMLVATLGVGGLAMWVGARAEADTTP